MSTYEQNSLESIIKVEPDKFQTISVDDALRLKANILLDPIVKLKRLNFETTITAYEAMRLEANIFSDPVVLVKRLSSKTATVGIQNFTQLGNNYSFNKNLANLVRKGNEEARKMDPHTCYLCRKTYASRRNLKIHMESMHNNGNPDHRQSKHNEKVEALIRKGNKGAGSRDPHTCCFCRKTFLTRFKLKHHLESSQAKGSWDHCKWKSKHSEKLKALVKKGNEKAGSRDPHTCCFCKKLFAFRSSLKLHIEAVHYREDKFSCDLCRMTFFNKPSIAQHLVGFHSKKWLYCNFCNYKTRVARNYEFHKRKHATTCSVCNEQVDALKTHMKLHRVKVPCSICHKKVFNATMKKHMKTQHGKFECKICNEVFENRKYLRWHNLRKHYDGKLYECQCGSVYKTGHALKNHKQTHVGKIACRVCQKEFSHSDALAEHWKTHHLQVYGNLDINTLKILNRNGPFICDKCGKKLPNRISFSWHVSNNHRRKISAYCDLCPRSFIHKHYLLLHLKRDHLRLRAFKCEICGHRSASKGNLETHMKQHISKTKCNICHKLVKHMYTHLQTHVKVRCPICRVLFSKPNLNAHKKTHRNGSSRIQL